MEIKDEIISYIEIYKKYDMFQQNVALKMDELVISIGCFYCLDQKQCWDDRADKVDKKGDYCIKICQHCQTIPIENLWIEDCISSDLVGPSGIKLFRSETPPGEKFKALEHYIIKQNPELIQPCFTKRVAVGINKKEKIYNLDLEIKKIIKTCTQSILLYMGNVQSTIEVLKQFHLNMVCFDDESNKHTLLCEEIMPNHFMYIVIKNNSTQKTKNRFGFYNYQRFFLDIQIDIFEIKTLNYSAQHLCNRIRNEPPEKNINEIMKLFESTT